MRAVILVGALSLIALGGCASVPPAQVGQTAGTIAGAALIPGIGAPIGALAGLVAGMLVQGELDKTTEKRERRELSQQLGGDPHRPESSEASVPHGEPARVWVDETVQDGRLIVGHFEVRYLP